MTDYGDASRRVHNVPAALSAGERNEESATASYVVTQSEANVTRVDASGGDVTDQAVSGGVPGLLLGWYVTAGAADTLTVKDGSTTRFTETVAAGDASADIGAVPPGVGLRFTTDITVSLTTVATALIYWRPI